MAKISRRDFLKGSGATALTLMSASLLGCGTEAGTTTAAPAPETTAAPTTEAPTTAAPVGCCVVRTNNFSCCNGL